MSVFVCDGDVPVPRNLGASQQFGLGEAPGGRGQNLWKKKYTPEEDVRRLHAGADAVKPGPHLFIFLSFSPCLYAMGDVPMPRNWGASQQVLEKRQEGGRGQNLWKKKDTPSTPCTPIRRSRIPDPCRLPLSRVYICDFELLRTIVEYLQTCRRMDGLWGTVLIFLVDCCEDLMGLDFYS
ncbi:hypothetical protein CEXT_631381 [Caerostris extrusa]|uniref:Uncharacterized protein n=1 Tax=Caerostris extrusa TaxID=172846 RepID=A0AAV4YAV4_CAEEX|nr:hypothetical protein CEXT_631381 [Caerostris extrusa]